MSVLGKITRSFQISFVITSGRGDFLYPVCCLPIFKKKQQLRNTSNILDPDMGPNFNYCKSYQQMTLVGEEFTNYLLVSSADNLCKQFGSRSGPTCCRT